MSPTRRDILKLSAVTVAAALSGSVASIPTAAQPEPEPVYIESMATVMVSAWLSDGRLAMIGQMHLEDEDDKVATIVTV